MNERIKELVDAVNIPHQVGDNCYTVSEQELEKFAEMIVRECLKELRYTVVDTQECRQDKSTDYQVGWEDGMFEAGETIKQCFGVE